MNKTAFVSAIIVVFLLSGALETLIVSFALANPFLFDEFPTEPVTTPPAIVVHSPIQNENYDSNEVWLNFTIIKPDTWFKFTNQAAQANYLTFGNITSVYFILDNGELQNIPMKDITYFNDVFPNKTLEFSTRVSLMEGAHDLMVGLEADSYYYNESVSYNETTYKYPLFLSSVVVNGSSEIVSFTVLQEPSPATIVFVASVGIALAVIGLFIYFKKNKR
jgi:hypothetical protein